MFGYESLGKLLIIVGIFIFILGLLFLFVPKIPFLGKLPGDIFIQNDKFSVFFPVITCLLLSGILTLVINIIVRVIKK
jgi:hypothetical protein